MGWLQSSLFGLSLIARTPPHKPPLAMPVVTDVAGVSIASCDDFVHVAGSVFTGRQGAWFAAHGHRADLGGATFGPGALSIDGVDPARWLMARCVRPTVAPGA